MEWLVLILVLNNWIQLLKVEESHDVVLELDKVVVELGEACHWYHLILLAD